MERELFLWARTPWLRTILSESLQFERLFPYVKGNIGFVFTDQDLKEIRELIIANKVAAPAHAGAFAPKDVIVSACSTGMESRKTSFFQALGIPTKIARGLLKLCLMSKSSLPVPVSESDLQRLLC